MRPLEKWHYRLYEQCSTSVLPVGSKKKKKHVNATLSHCLAGGMKHFVIYLSIHGLQTEICTMLWLFSAVRWEAVVMHAQICKSYRLTSYPFLCTKNLHPGESNRFSNLFFFFGACVKSDELAAIMLISLVSPNSSKLVCCFAFPLTEMQSRIAICYQSNWGRNDLIDDWTKTNKQTNKRR